MRVFHIEYFYWIYKFEIQSQLGKSGLSRYLNCDSFLIIAAYDRTQVRTQFDSTSANYRV